MNSPSPNRPARRHTTEPRSAEHRSAAPLWQLTQTLLEQGQAEVWHQRDMEDIAKDFEQLQFAVKALQNSLPQSYLPCVKVMIQSSIVVKKAFPYPSANQSTPKLAGKSANQSKSQAEKPTVFRQTWLLITENAVIASRLKMLLNEVDERIVAQFRFHANLKVVVCPRRWRLSGIALTTRTSIAPTLPNEQEALAILKQFFASH